MGRYGTGDYLLVVVADMTRGDTSLSAAGVGVNRVRSFFNAAGVGPNRVISNFAGAGLNSIRFSVTAAGASPFGVSASFYSIEALTLVIGPLTIHIYHCITCPFFPSYASYVLHFLLIRLNSPLNKRQSTYHM